MEYLFDTNIFVESKKNLPMDIWPTFWTKMVMLIKSGKIHSIDKVKEEIEKGGDELTDWIHKHAPRGFFLKQDSSVMAKMAETIDWAQKNPVRFSQSAISDYVNVADSYLVATAAAKKMVLVTYEKSNPQRRNRVMIPDACIAIGVRFCDLNTVLRELGVPI